MFRPSNRKINQNCQDNALARARAVRQLLATRVRPSVGLLGLSHDQTDATSSLYILQLSVIRCQNDIYRVYHGHLLDHNYLNK